MKSRTVASRAFALLTVLLTFGVVAQPSDAGQVTVTPNFNSGFSMGYNGWSNGYWGFSMYLGGTNPVGQEIGGPGTYMWARTPKVGDSVSISAVYNSVRHRSAAGTQPFWLRLCLPGNFDVNTGGCGSVPQNTVNWPSTNGSTNTSSGGASCGLGRCDAVQLEVNQAYTSGFMEFTVNSVVLTDSTNPTNDTTYGSNALRSAGWKRGTVAGGVASADTGGLGLTGQTLAVDAVQKASKSYSASCNYTQWAPCPASGTWTPVLDTTALADGPHTVSFASSDAAGNTGTAASFAVKTDNTKPGVPAELVANTDGLDGWSATNDFDVSWSNTGETDETTAQSGLESVVIDVNPTASGQTDPAPVTVPIGGSTSGISATLDSVSGVTVPAIGQWSVRLQLVDKAGNASDVGDGSGGSENSDLGVGYDPNPPAKADGQANGWVSRAELANGSARQTWNLPTLLANTSPVCGWGLSTSDNADDAGRTSIDVHAPTREWTFPNNLTEGHHWAHIRAISCALEPSNVTDHQEVHVDLTDPIVSFEGVQDGRWYKDGQQVTMRGADALSGMAGADPVNFPNDATRGAYISYSINGAGPADEDSPRGGEAQVNVTGEGYKQLKFSPVDLAGNKANATEVNFGIDATTPEGYLESQDLERPTLIRAPLSDGVSGVENAVLQVREGTSGPWTSLPTGLASFSGGQVNGVAKSAIAEARFPDTKLPEGTYQVRVAAYDQAGNELLTSKDKNGHTYTVTNPMRTATGLSAFVYRGLHKCKRAVKSKCVKKKKGRVYLVGGKTSTSVGYKRAGIVQGYLTTSSYRPLSKQHIEIYGTVQGQPEKLEGTASTKSDGSYYFRLKPGVSRKVRVVFAGTELLRETESHVTFGAAAKVTLKISKRKVKTGGKVTFAGKVIAVDKAFPQRGKIIALQYYSGGKWRPAVAITRTKKNGTFKVTYRFDRIPRRVKAKIKFRVWAPTELGFSHANSASRTKVVKVNF